MASIKGFLRLALLVALVLFAAARRDLAQTSTVKENEKASNVGGVDFFHSWDRPTIQPKDPLIVHHPPPAPKGCNHRVCCDGYGHCSCNGWCIWCCSYAGEAVDSAEP